MKEPGLDNRHRDKNGEISRKHGNTLVRTLRKIYGSRFAPGCGDEEKLSDVLQKFDEASLSQLHRDHDGQHLEKDHVSLLTIPNRSNPRAPSLPEYAHCLA